MTGYKVHVYTEGTSNVNKRSDCMHGATVEHVFTVRETLRDLFKYIAAFALYSIPHCTLKNFSLTTGSAAIPSIPICHESSLARLLLILCTGQWSTAAHCPHLLVILRVSGVSVSIYSIHVNIRHFIPG